MKITTVERVVYADGSTHCYSVQVNGLSLRDYHVAEMPESSSKWLAEDYCTRVNSAIDAALRAQLAALRSEANEVLTFGPTKYGDLRAALAASKPEGS